MTKAIEELKKVLALLKVEKKEDLEQYKAKVINTSVKQRKKEGVCWYPVYIRKNYFGKADRLILELERSAEIDQPHVFSSGKVISFFSNHGEVEAGENNVSGVVNYVRNNTMVITLNVDDLPDWAGSGKLGVDLLFDEASYREMEYTMKKMIESDGNRTAALRDILLGQEPASFDENYVEEENADLNFSQNKALNLIKKAKDVAIIHGPPGTGKTTTIIQAIKQTLQYQHQVLVCAPSNAAVDLLAEKLGEQDIKVIRLGHPARVTDNILSKTLDSQIANHKDYPGLRVIRKRAEEFKNMGMKYKRNFGYAEREQRKLLLSESKSLRDEADQLEFYIVSDLLEKADVIACTLVGASHTILKGKKFETVFIDEAAQALEPACWIPILKAEKVVFAGDHCQLPPTIKSFEAAKEGLSNTLFEKCIQRNKVDVMLQVQYRMHEEIMNFSGSVFYDGILQAHDSVRNALLLPGDKPVQFIDTAGCGFTEQSDFETRSLYNVEEANLLLKLVEEQINTLTPERILEEDLKIGIISPYKLQVKQLTDLYLANEAFLPVAQQITINTIDAFQGQERDMIFISLVRSNEENIIGFLSDVRRMNVAMTRAKKKLVIIGDSATLGSHPFYDKFLNYINKIDSYRSAYEFMY
ncbi:MAG: AAA domain-containing protein [Bacteroidota bacterium]|nr:AAA domain-containing protein [Bacteroidota bacterium]